MMTATHATAKQESWSKRGDEIQQDAYLKQKQEERRKYMEMAEKREQIIALLKKQRDERIKKEMISYRNKRRQGNVVENGLAPNPLPPSSDEDQKEVQKLQ
ncbi:cilia- and flagella-associated protein HOATZ isoform X3 [Puntigrus tetrazona]|uniref:cilia- and flagella-associated protein HOATZ isoform X3 n=1 Tax=Puntigrus tetrazona TaxID=1606681 RepID=UPI001C8AA11F|nr:cilia- and flagella-associated protein HOATZ isoform X3 [Puntigrus tetrazona]